MAAYGFQLPQWKEKCFMEELGGMETTENNVLMRVVMKNLRQLLVSFKWIWRRQF